MTANLNTLLLKELLQSVLTKESGKYTVLSYSQICQIPDHYQVYDEPKELQKEMGFSDFVHPNRRKWAHLYHESGKTTVYLCSSSDTYQRIKYPETTEIEGHIVLKGAKRQKQIKRFLYLISKERADEIKVKSDEERVMAIKEFESNIDTDDLRRHILKWTKGYFKEIGIYHEGSNVLNMEQLSHSAYVLILSQIFSWYYVTQDKTWEDILNSDEPDIEIGLEYNHFYDYYPIFSRLGEITMELSNNLLSVSPRNTEHGKISIKYNWLLVKYAKLRCPKMDIKLEYW